VWVLERLLKIYTGRGVQTAVLGVQTAVLGVQTANSNKQISQERGWAGSVHLDRFRRKPNWLWEYKTKSAGFSFIFFNHSLSSTHKASSSLTDNKNNAATILSSPTRLFSPARWPVVHHRAGVSKQLRIQFFFLRF